MLRGKRRWAAQSSKNSARAVSEAFPFWRARVYWMRLPQAEGIRETQSCQPVIFATPSRPASFFSRIFARLAFFLGFVFSDAPFFCARSFACRHERLFFPRFFRSH